MSPRIDDQRSVTGELAALEAGQQLRAEDRRRFSRRVTDAVEPPALSSLQEAVADLRERVDSAQEIRDELIAARDVVAALREELRAAQAELSAERVASRRARMQAAFLEAELRRREDTEEHLRAALSSLTEVVADPADTQTAAAIELKERALDQERALRRRAELELAQMRTELERLRERPVAGEPQRPDPGAVAELREALAELSGQGDRGRPVTARDEDFDAAAARLRKRAEHARLAARPAVELAPRLGPDPQTPWLRDRLRELAAEEPERAERLVLGLLRAQAGCAPLPITYGLEIRGGARRRVSVMHQGAAVAPLDDVGLDGRVSGPLDAIIPLAAGGATGRLSGARVRGRQALRPLLAARRAPLQLGDLGRLLHPLEPGLVLELALLAVDPARVDRDGVVDVVVGDEVHRIELRRGACPHLTAADSGPAGVTISSGVRELPEQLAGQRAVAVDGDASLAGALLGWIAAGAA